MADLGYWDMGDDSPSSTSSASPSQTGSAGRYENPTDDGFATDLFRDKFMSLATGGSSGEKLLRGFLVGLAIGLVVACFVCCWYPCCRGQASRRRAQRRSRIFMRPRWMRNRQDGGVVASGEADPEVGIVNQEQRATGDNTSTENQPTQEAGVIMNSSSQTGPETNVSNTPALESNLGMEPAATAGALRRSEEQGAQR